MSESVINSISIVFCPKAAECGVHKTWLLLENYNEQHHFKLKIEKWVDSFRQAFKELFKHVEVPKFNFVFAHGKPNEFGFETFSGKILGNNWWLDHAPYDIGIFHACSGAKVLVNNGWDEVFTDWVSYTEDLPILYGLETTDMRWNRTFTSMIGALNQMRTGNEIKFRLKEIYKSELNDLKGLPCGSGGEIMKVHLLRAHNCIISKSENI
jgi:hypothetical protein